MLSKEFFSFLQEGQPWREGLLMWVIWAVPFVLKKVPMNLRKSEKAFHALKKAP